MLHETINQSIVKIDENMSEVLRFLVLIQFFTIDEVSQT